MCLTSMMKHQCRMITWTVRLMKVEVVWVLRDNLVSLFLSLLVSSAPPALCFIFPVSLNHISSSSSSSTTSFLTVWEQNSRCWTKVCLFFSVYRLYRRCSTATRSTSFTETSRWVQRSHTDCSWEIISERGWGDIFCWPECNATTRVVQKNNVCSCSTAESTWWAATIVFIQSLSLRRWSGNNFNLCYILKQIPVHMANLNWYYGV